MTGIHCFHCCIIFHGKTISQYITHSTLVRHLGLFPVMNNAGMYTLVLIMFLCTYVCMSVRYLLGIEFLGQRIWACSPLVDIAKQVFKV